MKTNELIGPALDWAVAKATLPPDRTPEPSFVDLCVRRNFCPSEAWEQGGPIIEREGIEFRASGTQASIVDGRTYYGPTHLIAAMRCYVASKMGNNIDIPKELT